MVLQKKDFVEVDFTARVKGGEVFDSTVKEELEKLHHGHDHPVDARPFVFCLGEGMFLKSVEDMLIGKPDSPAHYDIELNPEQAFGKREPKLVQMVPLAVFKQQNANPVPGAMFNFDGRAGKVLTVSGGRVMVDFNNPLAGKIVDYSIDLRRKVTDMNEKVRALNEFLFRRDFDFSIEGNKLLLKADKGMKQFAEMFKDKFKEILGLELEVQEVQEKPESKENREKSE